MLSAICFSIKSDTSSTNCSVSLPVNQTSALFHGSLLHIGMNMMSTAAIGGALEKKIGTLLLGATILWGIFLTSAIYVAISWLLWAVFGYQKMMLQHSVGFSGVIFQLSVMESNLSPDRVRSVFGMVDVSSRLYPWALLVALQFIMPHISFLGHLSGILVGSLQYHGLLDKLLPSHARLRQCETSERWAFLRRQPGYRPTPEASALRERDLSGGDVRAALSAAVGAIGTLVGNVCETIQVIVFGRGADLNDNIQLGAPWGSASAEDPAPSTRGGAVQGAIQDFEDDDEWVGLPEAIQLSTEEV